MIFRVWIFGSIYCRINNYVSYMTVSLNVFTLLAISVDRRKVGPVCLCLTYLCNLFRHLMYRTLKLYLHVINKNPLHRADTINKSIRLTVSHDWMRLEIEFERFLKSCHNA